MGLYEMKRIAQNLHTIDNIENSEIRIKGATGIHG